jgi:hypothetical protein
MDAETRLLSDTLIYEIVNAVGLKKTRAAFRTFSLFFQKAAGRLAEIGVTADRMIATDGFPAASGWMSSHWVRDVSARGRETIPATGPLLVVSNHCGAYDFLVIPSQLGRRDLKIISSDIHFLKNLPNACDHLIFLTDDPRDRMSAAREGIRHLQSGGALLLFGTGLVDPDPAVFTGAEKEIGNWSPSIDLFLRQVPQANVLVTIASGIVSSKWAHSPLPRLRRIEWEQRRLAEFGQVLSQLFRPGSLYVSPRVSFAPPIDMETLRRESGSERVLAAVIARGKELLAEHCKTFGDCAMLEKR